MFLIYLLLFVNFLFLSYEFIIFNEEFFIAFMFFSFFLAASPAISGLLMSSYKEDKSRVFSYVVEDIFTNYSFLQNYVNYLSLYESNREFIFQYVSFLSDGLFFKFVQFYDGLLLNKSLTLEKRVPEIFFSFYEKLLTFITIRFQGKFLEYFLHKWDILIFNEINSQLDLSSNSLSVGSDKNEGWVYGAGLLF
jgi:hypothetical protein